MQTKQLPEGVPALLAEIGVSDVIRAPVQGSALSEDLDKIARVIAAFISSELRPELAHRIAGHLVIANFDPEHSVFASPRQLHRPIKSS
jgi:hypothetical protein